MDRPARGHDQHGARDVGQRLVDRVGKHAVLRIDGRHPNLVLADPEVAQRRADRRVAGLADDHGQRRRALQSDRLQVHIERVVDALTARGEAREVGHLPARHEADRGVTRKVEQLLEPAPGHPLEADRHGRDLDHGAVLVPRRDHPVRRLRRGQGAADDPPVEPRRAHGDQPVLGDRAQLLHNGQRIAAGLRQLIRDAREHAGGIQLGSDGPVVECFQPGQHGIANGCKHGIWARTIGHGALPGRIMRT